MAQQYRDAGVLGQDFDVGSDPRDLRSADEHTVEPLGSDAQPRHVEIGLETVELASVTVALHRDVDRPERPLVGSAVEHFGCEQDHAGTGSERRHALGETGGQRVEQLAGGEQPRHRRRLATGHHERVDAFEIDRGPNLVRGVAETVEQRLMGTERALQRKHADHVDAELTNRARRTAG